jgi:DNA repair protein RecN (Recombination protein N)
VITQLYIRNYAIIKEIDIQFQEGLSIITGETGAGKSILIGALSLILGERADSQSLLNPNEKCIIEGRFDIKFLPKVKLYLTEHQFDVYDELIIRREIVSTGKSRIFINDTPATLSLLNPLSALLIDLHRQFDTLEIHHSNHQLNIVDDIANLQADIAIYEKAFTEWKSVQKKYNELVEKNKLIKQENDYNQYLYDELEKLNLQTDELEEIEKELLLLSNSESLKLGLQKASFILSQSEQPVLSELKTAIQSIESFASSSEKIQEITSRIQSTIIELKDINAELDELYENTNYNEEKIVQLTDRLNDGNRLLKKHHAQQTNELIALQQQLETKLNQAAHADDAEKELKEVIETLFVDVASKAEKLSKARNNIIPTINTQVNMLLGKVGMPNAQLNIAQTTVDYNSTGKDKIEFLFDANKTGKFQSIAKVASGGELSRLMLCIKSLQAKSTNMPTLIFDEIDTGISGETAIQVGHIMKELSLNHQIISITHLPQIASKAEQHLYIYKEENTQGEVFTKVKKLEGEDRINVLAEMLSGKGSTLQAKEMIIQLMK